MGLKQNISIPFGYFYISNNPRFNYIRNVNSKSWLNYGFLVKSSLFPISLVNSNNIHSNFNFSSSNYLSDPCLRIRRDPYLSSPQSTFLGVDLSISNYNYKFYYYDMKQRAQFFWIANQNYFRSGEFLISSFENPTFKDVSLIDWSSWVSYASRQFKKFLRYNLTKSFKYNNLSLQSVIHIPNLLKIWISNCFSFNFNRYSSIKRNKINKRVSILFYYLCFISIFNKNNKLLFRKLNMRIFNSFSNIFYFYSFFNIKRSENFSFFSSLNNLLNYKKNISNLNNSFFINLISKNSIKNNLLLNWNLFYTKFINLLKSKTNYLNLFSIRSKLLDVIYKFNSKNDFCNNSYRLLSNQRNYVLKKLSNHGRYNYPLMTETLNGFYMKKIGVFFYRNNGSRRLFRKRLDFSFRRMNFIFPVYYYDKTFFSVMDVFFDNFNFLYKRLKSIFFQSTLKFFEFNIDNFYYQFILSMMSFVIISHYPLYSLKKKNNNITIKSKRAFFLLSKLKRISKNPFSTNLSILYY